MSKKVYYSRLPISSFKRFQHCYSGYIKTKLDAATAAEAEQPKSMAEKDDMVMKEKLEGRKRKIVQCQAWKLQTWICSRRAMQKYTNPKSMRFWLKIKANFAVIYSSKRYLKMLNSELLLQIVEISKNDCQNQNININWLSILRV